MKLQKTTLRIIPVFLGASLLSACATLDRGDCVTGNWAGIGFNDAIAGLKAQPQFNAHTQACTRFKIAPDVAVYNTGYKKGLTQFCTKPNGYKYGLDGKQYYGVCPSSTSPQFLTGYLSGLRVTDVRLDDEIDELRHKLLRRELRLSRLKRQKNPDAKRLKKLRSSINNLESSISSRRAKRRDLRDWFTQWALKLR